MVRCSLARLADCLSARTHYLHVSAGDGAAAAAVTNGSNASETSHLDIVRFLRWDLAIQFESSHNWSQKISYSNVVGISAIGHNTASNSNEIARTHMIKSVSTEMNVQIEIHCNQITRLGLLDSVGLKRL